MSLEQLLASIPPGSHDETLARQVNFEQLPAHVAIIMDGNGRWAAQRHLPRVEGHRAGIDSVRDVVETSARLGIGVLTLYAFSVENWKRPRAEVNTLMMLLKRYIRLELSTLLKNNIQFRVIGRPEELSPDVQHELEIGIRQTATNTGMQFNIALNYGGRAEIVDAARRAIAAGVSPDDLDEQRFSEFLYTAGQPDPDLLIRTSGEMRVSNFLLWQIAYAEIWVTETLWPDFRRGDLLDAVVAYQKRDRRYGGIKPSPVALGAKRRGRQSSVVGRQSSVVGRQSSVVRPQSSVISQGSDASGRCDDASAERRRAHRPHRRHGVVRPRPGLPDRRRRARVPGGAGTRRARAGERSRRLVLAVAGRRAADVRAHQRDRRRRAARRRADDRTPRDRTGRPGLVARRPQRPGGRVGLVVSRALSWPADRRARGHPPPQRAERLTNLLILEIAK